MPWIKCHNCGRERLVVAGKRKKCRKCGTPMTTIPPKAPKTEKLTVDDLKSRYPEAVAEIVKTAQVEALAETAEQDSKALAEVTTLKLRMKEVIEKAIEKTFTKRDKQINKMTVPKFAEQFPKLYEKLDKVFTKASGKKNKNKDE